MIDPHEPASEPAAPRAIPLSYRSGLPGDELPARVRASIIYHLVVYVVVMIMLAALFVAVIVLAVREVTNGQGEVTGMICAMLVIALQAFYFIDQIRQQFDRLNRRETVGA
jgi:hypothetical protein